MALITTALLARFTITVSDRDHLALKLLALQKNEKLLSLAQEAIRQYLDREGAYNLAIRHSPPAAE